MTLENFVKLCDERMFKYYGTESNDFGTNHYEMFFNDDEGSLENKIYEATEWVAEKYNLQKIVL